MHPRLGFYFSVSQLLPQSCHIRNHSKAQVFTNTASFNSQICRTVDPRNSWYCQHVWVRGLEAEGQCSSTPRCERAPGLFCVWTRQDPSLSFSSILEEALFLAYLWCVRTKSEFTVTSVASAYIVQAHVPGTASKSRVQAYISKTRRQTASCQFPSQGSSQHDIVCLLTNFLFVLKYCPCPTALTFSS